MSHPANTVGGRNLVIIVIAASSQAQESRVMKEQTGTTDQLEDQHNESTYALLIRSEEKSRNVIEMAICPILILSAVIAIWQFAQQPVNIPAAGLKGVSGAIFDSSVQNSVCRDESHTLLRNRATKIKA